MSNTIAVIHISGEISAEEEKAIKRFAPDFKLKKDLDDYSAWLSDSEQEGLTEEEIDLKKEKKRLNEYRDALKKGKFDFSGGYGILVDVAEFMKQCPTTTFTVSKRPSRGENNER